MGKRIADMTPEQRERQRERKRVAHMAPEQRERRRERERVANMTPEQRERKRERDRVRRRVGNMTPERLERERELRREQVARYRRSMTTEERSRVRGTSSIPDCLVTVAPRTPWTPDEDAVVLDPGLSNYQRAVTLGRTLSSVRTRRRDLLKKETSNART